MNDQTGLHAAVIANRYEICEYLLNLKLKKLNENDIFQYQQQNILNETKRLNKSRTSSQISTSNKSTNSNGDESTTILYILIQLKLILILNLVLHVYMKQFEIKILIYSNYF